MKQEIEVTSPPQFCEIQLLNVNREEAIIFNNNKENELYRITQDNEIMIKRDSIIYEEMLGLCRIISKMYFKQQEQKGN